MFDAFSGCLLLRLMSLFALCGLTASPKPSFISNRQRQPENEKTLFRLPYLSTKIISRA
ncbi:hypothetical protein [Kingella oralis]|uniref:hypothetical protein n=1 Tax=Kingella oralis TaxID=505 RepID=UPI0034E44CED